MFQPEPGWRRTLTQRAVHGHSAERNLQKCAAFAITMLSLFDSVETGGLNTRFKAFTITHEAANNLGSGAVQILQSADLDQGNYRNHFSAAPFEVRLLPKPGDCAALANRHRGQKPMAMPLQPIEMAACASSSPWQRGAAPIIVGQLHNGQHDLPWPAGQDSGANHIGAISGWHLPHLDGGGASQWLVDDSQGQLRMRLATHGSQGGWSELTLGHIIAHSGQGGAGQAQRGTWLGEGFYGHTDGWAVVRAGQGLLLSTTARTAQGASVQSTQMDAAEAVAQLKAAQQLGQALSASAQQQGAQALHAFDAQQAVSSHVEAMCPTAQGKYTGLVNGQDAKKANGRTLTDPVERFAKPLVHLDTPVTAAFVTPSNISVFSGQDTGLAVQGDVQITAGHTLSSVSGQTTSLYTHAGGIKAITANGGLSLRAHTDAQQIWADQGITVQSTTDEIRIQASESVTLSAGQSAIVIKGGDITFTCPGNWTVKGATHDWGAGGGGGASLMALPDSRVKLFDEQIRAVSKKSGKPIAGQAYTVRMPDGATINGTTDEHGKTHRLATATPEDVKVTWLPPLDAEEFPDVPVDEAC